MPSAIAKISKRASAIYKKGGSWKAAQKKAKGEYNNGKLGKVGGAKKKRVIKKKRVRSVSGTSTRKVGRTPSHKRPKAIGSVASHKAAAKAIIKEQLAWNLLNQSQAKTVRSKKKLAKRTAKLKKELKALS